MIRSSKALSAALVLIATQGCVSLIDLTTTQSELGPSASRGPHIYGGTRINLEMIGQKGCMMPTWCLTLLLLIDLPFSIVLDTLLLPISIPTELFFSDPEPIPENPDS